MTKANAKQQKNDAARAEQGAAFHERLKAVGGSDCHAFNAELLSRLTLASWPVSTEPETRATTERLMKISEAALASFHPTDEVEGMLAAQAVALHHATIEAMRRTTLPGQAAAVPRLWREAASLSGAMVEAMTALDRWRHRAKPSSV